MGEILDKLKGRFKQAAGRVSGDRSMEAEGHTEEKKGQVKGGFENVKRSIKDAFDPNRQPPKRI
jgi:uncharacterized protein YjbJ (UPF0337 family)